MHPRKPRNLRPDEIDLWQKVVEQAVPLHPDRPVKPQTEPAPNPKTPTVARPRPGEVKQVPLPTRPTTGPPHPPAPHPVQMDRKRYGKMKKGRLVPEARLDLHGFTLAQAHPALNRFILGAAADGLRLVLVITGKGKLRDEPGPIPERTGALRHQVPHWLGAPPLKPHVLQIAEAHVKHGGQGAYYVYLRRMRA